MAPKDSDDSEDATRRPSDSEDDDSMENTEMPSVKEPTMGPDSSDDDESPPPSATMMSASPTMKPTEKWEQWAFELKEGNNKCGTSPSQRSFRLTFTSLDNCIDRCHQDSSCMYASTNGNSDAANKFCIGCKTLNSFDDTYQVFEMIRSNRRQLSEVELLRAENAALRAQLEQLMN